MQEQFIKNIEIKGVNRGKPLNLWLGHLLNGPVHV